MQRRNWPRRKQSWSLGLAGGCWLLLPGAQAQAHTTFPGLGEFASGFLHPLTTPPHLLVLLALGLWLGQHAPLRIKEPAIIFAAAAAVGLLLTAALHLAGIYPPLLIVVGLCVGACVAVGTPLPLWVKASVGGIAALLLALDSGVEAGTAPASAIKILVATWACLLLCFVNAAFYVSLLPMARWIQTGVRVLGSWIVAIAFLLLAFALRR